MPLVIFEKMVLTEGITFWGRKPATTITKQPPTGSTR